MTAKLLANETCLLDEAERQAFALAARMIERVEHRQLKLMDPPCGVDYLAVMCAHLIVADEDEAGAIAIGAL